MSIIHVYINISILNEAETLFLYRSDLAGSEIVFVDISGCPILLQSSRELKLNVKIVCIEFGVEILSGSSLWGEDLERVHK